MAARQLNRQGVLELPMSEYVEARQQDLPPIETDAPDSSPDSAVQCAAVPPATNARLRIPVAHAELPTSCRLRNRRETRACRSRARTGSRRPRRCPSVGQLPSHVIAPATCTRRCPPASLEWCQERV